MKDDALTLAGLRSMYVVDDHSSERHAVHSRACREIMEARLPEAMPDRLGYPRFAVSADGTLTFLGRFPVQSRRAVDHVRPLSPEERAAVEAGPPIVVSREFTGEYAYNMEYYRLPGGAVLAVHTQIEFVVTRVFPRGVYADGVEIDICGHAVA